MSQVHGAPEFESSDLVEELRRRLPRLVELGLRLPEVAAEDRKRRLDPERLKAVVLEGTEDLLRHTNPEIAAIREARAALHRHEASQPAGGRVFRRRPAARWRSRAATVLSFWLCTGLPVAVWQAWPPLSTAWGGPWVFLLFLAAAVTVIVIAHRLFRFAVPALASEGEIGDSFAGGATAVAVAMGLAGGFLLSLWQLWAPTMRATGAILTWVIWLVAGAAACVVVFFVYSFGLVEMTMTRTDARIEAGAEQEKEAETKEPSEAVARRKRDFKVVPVPRSFLAAAGWFAAALGLGVLGWWEADKYLGLGGRASVYLAASISIGVALASALVGWLGPVVLDLANAGLRRMQSDPNRRGSRAWRQVHGRLQANVDESYRRWQQAALEGPVVESIRRTIAELRQPPFTVTLDVFDAPGLRQMRSQEHVVATATFATFGDLTRRLAGGAVGVAGTRGSGKSTLLEYYRDGLLLEAGKEHICLFERVPIGYEPREFALYLYGALCDAVIAFVDRVKPTPPASVWRNIGMKLRRYAVILPITVVWLSAGYLGAALQQGGKSGVLQQLADGWWVLAAVVGSAVSIALMVSRRWGSSPLPARDAIAVTDLGALRASARQRLEMIQFEQRHTSGWSGKLGYGFGAEGTLAGSIESARRSLAYPDVVKQFHDFVALTVRHVAMLDNVGAVPLVVILDEMDKIVDTEDAQKFINEVKALFAVDRIGCLFLVSVSDDALASFERRGLPARDAFDSSFDMIFKVDRLTLADARSILQSRVIGLPEPFICLCYCLSGGLPRELIRIARSVVNSEEQTLDAICRRLLADDLHNKALAFNTIIARYVDDEPHASALMRHLLANTHANPAALLRAAAASPVPATVTGDLATPHHGELRRLQLEAQVYLYYCATVAEVFDDRLTEGKLTEACTAGGDGSFETLASVRQMFAINARLAWLTLDAFRSAWGGLAPCEWSS